MHIDDGENDGDDADEDGDDDADGDDDDDDDNQLLNVSDFTESLRGRAVKNFPRAYALLHSPIPSALPARRATSQLSPPRPASPQYGATT